jgi:hypothetical protein
MLTRQSRGARPRRDRRNNVERGLDAKLVLALVALAAMPILWLMKTYLGVGHRLFDLAIGAVVLFGVSLIVFLSVPALFYFAGWLVRKLRRPQ